MTVLCYRVPGTHHSAFSFGNFVEHFAVVEPAGVASAQIHAGCAATPENPPQASLPKFETLDSRQKERVQHYVEKMNLTAAREAGEVMERPVEDSLAIVPALCDSCSSFCDGSKGTLRLGDVGSGAGLPVIVLAIARSDWQVTLLESMKKQCTFLEHAMRINELTNVEVVRGRAEDFGHNLQFRECFDVAVARAAAEMRVLAEYCFPLVRVGGLFVAAKGHDPQVEVKHAGSTDKKKHAGRAIQLMGGSVLKVCTENCDHCLKERPTPRRYPRDPGTPKEPL